MDLHMKINNKIQRSTNGFDTILSNCNLFHRTHYEPNSDNIVLVTISLNKMVLKFPVVQAHIHFTNSLTTHRNPFSNKIRNGEEEIKQTVIPRYLDYEPRRQNPQQHSESPKIPHQSIRECKFISPPATNSPRNDHIPGEFKNMTLKKKRKQCPKFNGNNVKFKYH